MGSLAMMDLTKEGTMNYGTYKHSAALSALGVVVAGIAAALPCAAQLSVELTPVVGVYVPTAATIWPSSDFGCFHIDLSAPDFCRYPSMRQETSPAVGGRITAWLNNRTGIDLSLGYSRSRATGLPPSTSLRDTSATIVIGSARVLINLTPRMVRTSFSVAAGVSFVAHGGDAYAALNAYRLLYGPTGNATGWGPVVGVVARFMLAPRLAIRADLEDHHYKISGGGFQNDVVFSLGLSATLLMPW
jgi:hypothetical protein